MGEPRPAESISLQALRQGDAAAWEAATPLLWSTAYRAVAIKMSTSTESERTEVVTDVVDSEVVPQILEATKPSFQNAGSFEEILAITYTAAGNTAVDSIRKGIVRADEANREYIAERASQPDDVHENIFAKERNAMLHQAIDLLPPRYQEIVQLFYFQKLGTQEIADELDRRKGSICYDLSTARNMLEDILGDLGWE